MDRSVVRRTARIAGRLAGMCVLFVLALSAWNLAAVKWQHARNPVPGRFYLVNGRLMHLYCSGAGSPAIVIEAGASANSLGWQGVQTKLSPLTRVCTYDRAGHGWSEPRSGPRDAETIARELHALLDQAGVPRPLVLVGHSAGGLYVREYARQFPGELAGVVLADSSSPQQIDELPGWRQEHESDMRDRKRQLFWERLRVWSGWERLTGQCHDTPSPELLYLTGQYDALLCRPEYVGEDDCEAPYFEASFQQAARLTSFGNLPLLVLSRDPDLRREGITASAIAEQSVWSHKQEALKPLSPLSWRVIARGAGHSLHHPRLDLVVTEVSRLIGYLRGGAAPPFGSTLTE